jgi:hypothetical protein
MTKFKRIFIKIIKVFFTILTAILIVFKCHLMHVENKIISHYSTEINAIKDTVIIHFIHGSVAKEGCIYPRKRLGGLLGGHVEIELNQQVYGFRLAKLPVHIFVDNTDFNSKYEVNTKENWLKRTEYEKVTSIYLPITAEQKNKLNAILNAYLMQTPYDYAFFGKRCATSTAEILAQSGIICPLSNAEIMAAFISPKPLRNTLINLAENKHFLIKKKAGVDCRIWE